MMDVEKGAGGLSALTDVLCGDQVRLIKGVWDDGEDHHQPGWLAQTGDVLTVAEVHGSGRILAGFRGRDEYFWVLPGEYVPHNINSTT
jgi:hypothetical protein